VRAYVRDFFLSRQPRVPLMRCPAPADFSSAAVQRALSTCAAAPAAAVGLPATHGLLRPGPVQGVGPRVDLLDVSAQLAAATLPADIVVSGVAAADAEADDLSTHRSVSTSATDGPRHSASVLGLTGLAALMTADSDVSSFRSRQDTERSISTAHTAQDPPPPVPQSAGAASVLSGGMPVLARREISLFNCVLAELRADVAGAMAVASLADAAPRALALALAAAAGGVPEVR
jgi:hypothetical protein